MGKEVTELSCLVLYSKEKTFFQPHYSKNSLNNDKQPSQQERFAFEFWKALHLRTVHKHIISISTIPHTTQTKRSSSSTGSIGHLFFLSSTQIRLPDSFLPPLKHWLPPIPSSTINQPVILGPLKRRQYTVRVFGTSNNTHFLLQQKASPLHSHTSSDSSYPQPPLFAARKSNSLTTQAKASQHRISSRPAIRLDNRIVSSLVFQERQGPLPKRHERGLLFSPTKCLHITQQSQVHTRTAWCKGQRKRDSFDERLGTPSTKTVDLCLHKQQWRVDPSNQPLIWRPLPLNDLHLQEHLQTLPRDPKIPSSLLSKVCQLMREGRKIFTTLQVRQWHPF